MITFAIDYDDTLSTLNRDQRLAFSTFIDNLIIDGFKAVIVTYRSERREDGNGDIESIAEFLGLNIIYTDGKAKASFVEGDHVIWMDDKPETILMDKGRLECM